MLKPDNAENKEGRGSLVFFWQKTNRSKEQNSELSFSARDIKKQHTRNSPLQDRGKGMGQPFRRKFN